MPAPAPADFPAPAPRVASDQVEFGLDYVDTQTQDELAPERPDCPAPEPQLPPFELVPVDSQTQAEAAPPPDEFPAPEPRTPSAELPPFEVVALGPPFTWPSELRLTQAAAGYG